MHIKLNFPTQIDGLGHAVAGQILALTGGEALRLIAAGKARRVPLKATEDDDEAAFEERKRIAKKLGQNVDWHFPDHIARVGIFAQARREPDAGQKLVAAVKAKLAMMNTAQQKQDEEQTDKNGDRYRLQRRERTKGE